MPSALVPVWAAAFLVAYAAGARFSASYGAVGEGTSDAEAAASVHAAVGSPLALAGEGSRLTNASASLGGLSVARVRDPEPEDPGFKMPGLASLERGLPGQALVPSMVPPPGAVYQVKNTEHWRNSPYTKEYVWKFEKVEHGGRVFEVDPTWHPAYGRPKSTIAHLKGKWQSSSFGHQSMHAYDDSGKELFKIRASKNVWFQRRLSFRILPPGSKDNDDALFTIKEDQLGGGWRIYRGRERDQDMIYYCVSYSLPGWDVRFYKSTSESDPPVATIGWGGTKWKLGLNIQAGEDTALILAVSTILHMARGSD